MIAEIKAVIRGRRVVVEGEVQVKTPYFLHEVLWDAVKRPMIYDREAGVFRISTYAGKDDASPDDVKRLFEEVVDDVKELSDAIDAVLNDVGVLAAIALYKEVRK